MCSSRRTPRFWAARGARMDVAAGHDAVAHGVRAGKAGGPGGRAGWSMGKRHVACIAPVVFRLTRGLWELFWRTGFSAGLRLVLAMFWGTFRGESDIARGGGLLWIFMAGACFLLFFRFLLLLLIFWQRTKGELFVQKEEDFPYWIGRANVKPCQYTKAEKEAFGRVSQDIMDIILYTSPPNRLFWFSGMKSSRRGRRMTAESGVFSRTYLKAEYPMPSLMA